MFSGDEKLQIANRAAKMIFSLYRKSPLLGQDRSITFDDLRDEAFLAIDSDNYNKACSQAYYAAKQLCHKAVNSKTLGTGPLLDEYLLHSHNKRINIDAILDVRSAIEKLTIDKRLTNDEIELLFLIFYEQWTEQEVANYIGVKRRWSVAQKLSLVKVKLASQLRGYGLAKASVY